jgi:hypothetical protein
VASSEWCPKGPGVTLLLGTGASAIEGGWWRRRIPSQDDTASKLPRSGICSRRECGMVAGRWREPQRPQPPDHSREDSGVPEGTPERRTTTLTRSAASQPFLRCPIRDGMRFLLLRSGGSRPDYRPPPPARVPRSLREQEPTLHHQSTNWGGGTQGASAPSRIGDTLVPSGARLLMFVPLPHLLSTVSSSVELKTSHGQMTSIA